MTAFAKTGRYCNVITSSDDIDQTSFSCETRTLLHEIVSSFSFLHNVAFADALPIASRVDTPEVKWRSCYDLTKTTEYLSRLYPELTYRMTSKGCSIFNQSVPVLKFTFGDGSRTNKSGGGKAGMTFEEQLLSDLNGTSNTHSSIVDQINFTLDSDCNMLPSNTQFIAEGSKNQKRTFSFCDGKIKFDRVGNIGDLITDITATDGVKSQPISLKYGDQYYMINLSLRKILHLDDVSCDNVERNELLKYLGFVPSSFCEPYEIRSDDHDSYETGVLMNNWKELIRDVVGHGYLYVIGGDGFETVLNFSNPPEIKIERISEPVYAVPGVRKYSKISIWCSVGGLKYRIDAQFRGTYSTDKYPIYMRLLANKIKD